MIYSIRLYDTDFDEEVWCEEAAHQAVIYELKWSKNDRYLLSCSGDATCKVWDLLTYSSLMQNHPTLFEDEELPSALPVRQESAKITPAGSDPTTVAAENTVSLRPSKLVKLFPPIAIQVLSLPSSVHAYCGLFQEFPTGATPASANIFGDLQSWNDQMKALVQGKVPRVIVGAADGRIRVFDSGKLTGFIMVIDKNEDGQPQDFSPHDGTVNSLVIDERSKYLISADSVGDILAWRMDTDGWYQLLRKFRREVSPQQGPSKRVDSFTSGSILSLAIHPDKLKGLMLVLSRQPSTLKVVNMATYKAQNFCQGFIGLASYLVKEDDEAFSTGTFYRGSFSADGRYIICCVNTGQESEVYRLYVWDTYSGAVVPTQLSSKLPRIK